MRPSRATSNGPASCPVLLRVRQDRPQLGRGHGLAQAVAGVDGHHAVPPGGAAERPPVRPAPAAPDRDPWPLHGPRQHGDTGGGQILAVEGHRLAGPEGVQQVQGLIKPGGAHPGVGGLTERRELGGQRPEPGADDEPARGQHVQGGGFARHLRRPPPRQRVHHDRDPDPLGPGADRADHDGGIGDVAFRVIPEQMVPEEEAVPARLLGGHRQVDQQPRVTKGTDVGNPYRAARPPLRRQ